MSIESPGSLNDFHQRHPELSAEEVRETYGTQLDTYRRDLAAEKGITPADLHEQGFRMPNIILGTEEGQVA